MRLSRLAAAGWRVLRVTARQLKDPDVFLGRVRKALDPPSIDDGIPMGFNPFDQSEG